MRVGALYFWIFSGSRGGSVVAHAQRSRSESQFPGQFLSGVSGAETGVSRARVFILTPPVSATGYSVLRLWEGSKSRPNLSPGTCDVESTVFNCLNLLGKRAADSKHGFESRWGHQIVFVECFWSGFEKHSNVSRTHWRASYCLVSSASAFSS